MINVVLCGGSGTRLWPISRSFMPKQFIKIFDDSLFQMTIKRNRELCYKEIIVSNEELYFIALDQLEEIGLKESEFLLEPIGRDTAAAIALSAFSVDPEEILLITPSDHLIKNQKAYKEAVLKAKEFAKEGFLVTFGITPSSPHTGYGYIEADGYDVLSFKEKPSLEVAKEYLKKGGFYWNSGIFCFQAGVFLKELEKYAPKIYETSKEAFLGIKRDKSIKRVPLNKMEKIIKNSIDYAVMEHSKIVKVIPSNMEWSDLGSFDSLYEHFPKDSNQNAIKANTILENSKKNLFYASSKRVICAIDIENLIVVDSEDALLIMKKDSSQKVKNIVNKLKEEGSELVNYHKTVYRPWGHFSVLEEEDGYKIKRIVVKPGKRLSLQKHYHRSEHWIVVSGTAIIINGDKEILVRENESTYIPIGQEHRLSNPGKIDLVLIEAQVGRYLKEDDIIRIEDDFKREENC